MSDTYYCHECDSEYYRYEKCNCEVPTNPSTAAPDVTKNTTLINLWGGPGSGKSTTAADLFARMKLKGISCELVREYVKNWAWRGDKIGPWDDVYIFAKQLRLESCLYGKVEYIITDSPIEIGALYEQLYNPGSTFMQDVVLAARNRQIAAGIRIEDFLIRRNKAYVKEGRYQDEGEARRVDALAERWLRMNGSVGGGDCCVVDGAEQILKYLGIPV